MYQPMKDNVKDCDEVKKHAHEFDANDKRLVDLDVKARVAKIYSLLR